MMVATLQLKAPKLIVYFVSFTVVIFTILNFKEKSQFSKSDQNETDVKQPDKTTIIFTRMSNNC